jgi:hypothetical protein
VLAAKDVESRVQQFIDTQIVFRMPVPLLAMLVVRQIELCLPVPTFLSVLVLMLECTQHRVGDCTDYCIGWCS